MTNGRTDAFEALLTPVGQQLLGRLDPAAIAADPFKAATALRREVTDANAGADEPPTEVVSAALTQARLRGRAREKFGPDADRMYFTPDGLEQATRGVVARYRADRFRRLFSGAPDGRGARVADLCCGVGSDLLALAAAGIDVEGIDHDPLTAAVAAANVASLGLADRARVSLDDVARVAPQEYSAVFCDPARRGQKGRVFNPHAYSPPWNTVVDLAQRAPAACVKVAPGIPHDLVPEAASAEWISVAGEVKEAALWFGALAGAPRSATLFPPRSGDTPGPDPEPVTLAADPNLGPPPVAPVRRYLYEPDGAVVRAHLVAEAAAAVDGALLDPHIAYLSSDRLVDTPFCRAYEVTDVLGFSLKRIRSILRHRQVGKVTIKKRGSAVDVEKLRRDLKLQGENAAVIVLTRIGERPICMLCTEVTGVLESEYPA